MLNREKNQGDAGGVWEMSEADFTEEDYRAVAQRFDALIPYELAWGSSVAILINRGENTHVHGTGTLFRIADESFLITATHVIEQANKQNLRIAASNNRIIPLIGMAILGEPRFDVAAIQLSPLVVEQLEGKLFLRLHDVCFEQDLSNAMFWVCGFPEILSNHENEILKLTRFHHMADAYDGDTSALANYEERYHLLVAASLDEIRGVDGKPMEYRYKDGTPAAFPRELGGISGGSVWSISDKTIPIKTNNSQRARIVGVETGVFHRKECIKATRWKAVVNMLGDAMPELLPAIKMWRGNS
jgi:hypothetical protein